MESLVNYESDDGNMKSANKSSSKVRMHFIWHFNYNKSVCFFFVVVHVNGEIGSSVTFPCM